MAILGFFLQLLLGEALAPAQSSEFRTSIPPDRLYWWVTLAIWFWVFPAIVNVGFGKEWGRKPQVGLLLAVALFAVVSLLLDRRIWSSGMGWLLTVWMLYASLHLGSAFLLAGLVGTPGCEMRAWPHVLSRLRGRSALEYDCPAFLDRIDAWERRRGGGHRWPRHRSSGEGEE